MTRFAALGLGTITTYLARKTNILTQNPRTKLCEENHKTLGIELLLECLRSYKSLDYISQTNLKINNAITNALSRIQSISSLTHPEQHLVFLEILFCIN